MSPKAVVEELKQSIGEEWVSDNPCDLGCYAKDFTIVPGSMPDVIVLPKTTEDVQAIVKIAGKHQSPVVPLSTGFNHGGLAIPRRGGIVMDLRRMNEIVDIDEEGMTATIQPHVRLRSLWLEAQKISTVDGLTLKPALPLSFASVSVLSNYVSRGGAGWIIKYGWNAELIINMTWVLPNGEILKTGPAGIPNVGNVGIQYGPGPDIAGMFINADGNFGICTEMTIKLFPEHQYEKTFIAPSFAEEEQALEDVVNALYELAKEDICGLTYKSNQGAMAITLGGLTDSDPATLLDATQKHYLIIIIQGLTQEELDLKEKIVTEITQRNNLSLAEPEAMGMGDLASPMPFKAGFEVTANYVTGFRGAFQFLAGIVKLDKIPQLHKEYKKLIARFCKDPLEKAMAACSIQGPSPFARCGTYEIDWWWDHGDPEAVKRATEMVRKTGELLLKHGVPLFRNMHGLGEFYLPQWGIYYEILNNLKVVMDPESIMNPDIIPIGKDYMPGNSRE